MKDIDRKRTANKSLQLNRKSTGRAHYSSALTVVLFITLLDFELTTLSKRIGRTLLSSQL